MIKYIKIAVGIVSFILIIIVSNLINNYSGYIITDWTIRHDDQQKEVVSLSPMDIAESGIFTFETTVKNNGFDTLVMPQVNAYALKVYVNDDIVYQVGSFDMPTSNLWNDLQIIQIGGVSKLDQYQLRIESYCLHDAGFGEQPYLTNYEDSYRILGIQRFFNNSIILIILGSYLAIGTLLIMIARRSYTNKRRDDARLFAYFGFAALMFGVFMLDSVSRLSTGSLDTLLLVRKLNLISLYIAMYLLSEGIRKFMYQKSASRILRIITALSIILILISKDFIGLVKNQQIVFPVTFLFIVYVLWLNVRAKGNVLIFSSVFLFLTTLQSFLLIFGVIEGSLTWQYGLFVYMLSIAYIVAYKYDRMELHVDKVSEELIIDPLTKAYNRAYLSRLELKDNDIAVFIDIDDFKIFNDTYGHDAGDQLLVEFVKILREAKDEDLVIVRYGGDEFVIVLKNTVEVSVPLLMAHVKEALVTHFTDADFSYGYVKYTGELAETLIQADHQMYQMKRKRSKEQ